MKKTLTIILFFIASVGFSQTTDYKNAYQISKKLNTQYKLKITSLDSLVVHQGLFILDLNKIIEVNKQISLNDSLQISLLIDQKKFLNENINLYKKELSQRDKFWNSPAGGVVLGIVGTIALIHIIDYSLPQ
jgi:hypothetical protein|tara:strand:+ start:485 stop:880 length:396 start_codon:yes stop_codon:yes gene_type:complete